MGAVDHDDYGNDNSNDDGQVRHALGKLGERLETTVLEINEQGKEIDRLRVAVAGIFFFFKLGFSGYQEHM